MANRILVVDDEPSLRETITYNFEAQGYLVDTAENGEQAIEIARRNKPDLILLDVMLPGMDGFEVCRELRRDMNIPILMLSARDDEYDRVIGLEIGSDDYISKPFSMRELIARVKAHFRTTQLIREQVHPRKIPNERDQITAGNLTILCQRREIIVEGRTMTLRPKEFDLLTFFCENRGRIFTREEIICKVWRREIKGESRTIDVHVRWLRERIEPDPTCPVRIVTVHGIGYRFEG